MHAYVAPEIEQSKILLEELFRSFEGRDMQSTADQMALFENRTHNRLRI